MKNAIKRGKLDPKDGTAVKSDTMPLNLTSTPTDSQVSSPTFHVALDVSGMDSCYFDRWHSGNPWEQPHTRTR